MARSYCEPVFSDVRRSQIDGNAAVFFRRRLDAAVFKAALILSFDSERALSANPTMLKL